jgi:hypothetical protein
MPATTRARARRDLEQSTKPLFSARADRPALLNVPPLKYLMVDGQGDPGTSAVFQEAIQALFTVAYTLKFALKKQGDRRPFPPFHLEGLYWVPGREGCSLAQLGQPGGVMHWTLMIAQPAFVTARLLETVRAQVAKKKTLPALRLVRLERLDERAAAQVLHVGPYDAEGPTLERLFGFIAAAGGTPRGKHHEIYLNDPRRVGPAKTRTILRQPFTPP